MDVTLQLFEKAKEAIAFSYSPYSNFQVGACILGKNEKFYIGSNIENVSYGLTICAEAVAISQMIMDGEKEIKALLVSANHGNMCSPCGACRQRIAEFTAADSLIHMCNDKEIIQSISMDALLPYAFNDENIKR